MVPARVGHVSTSFPVHEDSICCAMGCKVATYVGESSARKICVPASRPEMALMTPVYLVSTYAASKEPHQSSMNVHILQPHISKNSILLHHG
jgi:hypothetical protein